MNRNYLKLSLLALVALVAVPAAVFAQKDKENKDNKDKEKSDKKQVETIVITKKDGNTDKVTVVIDGDKITVNGKPAEEYKDGDITVSRHSGYGNLRALVSPKGQFSYNWNDDVGGRTFFQQDENAAMLGVTTEKAEGGVKITDVTDESGAEKAGLKEDDIITKVNDKKIEDPDDLTKAIRAHKPSEKVTIAYLRDGKEQTVTAELTKWKGFTVTSDMNMGNMDVFPKIQGLAQTKPFTPGMDQYFSYVGNHPKLGLSVQDTDDGKGVKVIDVDDEGNAQKAGVKKDDVILSINDKDVNSADEVARIVRDAREKPSISLKINRGGKTQTIEVKMPRKLKTADL